MNETLHRTWPAALTAVVALLYAWVGLAAHGTDRILALTGAAVILTALVVARRSRPAAVVLLTAGALPLAAATWWSIVTPLLAVLALLLGWFAIRNVNAHRAEAATESTTKRIESADFAQTSLPVPSEGAGT